MEYKISQQQGYWRGEFHAMASPCELLIETDDEALANSLTRLASDEARRIEQKFSRYRDDNIIYRINNSHAKPVDVDEETSLLLDYADQCYLLSDGLFDITSGVLRKAWKFDGSDRVPSKSQVKDILPLIGWDKVNWQDFRLSLPEGMEIDLGGIGKEYAVDRAAMLIRARTDCSVLINYGGDLYATGPRKSGAGWMIGIEELEKRPGLAAEKNNADQKFQLKQGGVATSGDVYRFLEKNGTRYSHILNPKTGWPVKGGPHTVTVVAESCIEAGILATFAMLNGKSAKKFLKKQGVKHWIR